MVVEPMRRAERWFLLQGIGLLVATVGFFAMATHHAPFLHAASSMCSAFSIEHFALAFSMAGHCWGCPTALAGLFVIGLGEIARGREAATARVAGGPRSDR